jgi:pilus assembly protein TadC
MAEKLDLESRRRRAQERIKARNTKQRRKVALLSGVLLGFVSISITLFLNKKVGISIISFFLVTGLFFLYIHFRGKLKETAKIRKMEDSFPDFLQLMSSNLRAGMTIDKAMMLSSRPEFEPLDKEIISVGKDIATGKTIRASLLDMSKRIKSEKIEKTILLILSGIQSGGNIAILLEETATNTREREFVEKRAASNVLMYLIFIFIAASCGAPILFSLSTILVETLTTILSTLPDMQTTGISMPFTLSSISISITFIIYFSVVFIVMTNVLASRIIGLVNKGEESYGLRYLPYMLLISLGIFFVIRMFLAGYIKGFFGT